MASDDPNDSRATTIIGVVVALCTLTSICVSLRFLARMSIRKKVGADDYVTLAALILQILCGGGMCLMTRYGHGRHISTISPGDFENYLKVFYYDIIVYLICLGTIKTAILLQYLRIFTVKMRKTTVWATVIIGMWSVALVLIQIFTCTPIEGFWRSDIEKTCIPNLPSWYINAAGNILSDFFIFFLPIPVLWKLHLPLNQRLSLVAVFALGLFTCTISMIRIPFLSLGNDITYNNITIASWTMAELSCAIIGSCLPTLRPLLFKYFPRLDPSSSLRDPYASGGGGGLPSMFGSKALSARRIAHNRAQSTTKPRHDYNDTSHSSTEILSMEDRERPDSDGGGEPHRVPSARAGSAMGNVRVDVRTGRSGREDDVELGTTTAIGASRSSGALEGDQGNSKSIVVERETRIH